MFEKAGVNVSVVYGQMPPEAYRAATGEQGASKEMIPFFAAGISSVMHPHNPMAPTVHFNYRYFETDAPRAPRARPRAWWFGGGTDLTPSYIFQEDAAHFHGTLKEVCDKHDEEFYPRFKEWADDYFIIKHRMNERQRIGGVFFDDMNDRPQEELLAFATDMASAVVPAYVPLVAKHKDDEFTEQEREWQQMRRGRYVELNLVYDRGTTFGLRTGGRIESILMSLPLTARWQYDMQPEEGSREADALDAFRNPVPGGVNSVDVGTEGRGTPSTSKPSRVEPSQAERKEEEKGCANERGESKNNDERAGERGWRRLRGCSDPASGTRACLRGEGELSERERRPSRAHCYAILAHNVLVEFWIRRPRLRSSKKTEGRVDPIAPPRPTIYSRPPRRRTRYRSPVSVEVPFRDFVTLPREKV